MLAKRSSLGNHNGHKLEKPKKLIGSWLDFNKKVMNVEQTKNLLEYLPTIAESPAYPVYKKFLDDLISLIKELYLDHIVAHSHEQVYARLAHIMWKKRQLYKDTITLMGRFLKLRVRQETTFKRHSIKGYQKQVVDAETVAFGSAGVVVEDRHYYCNIIINK